MLLVWYPDSSTAERPFLPTGVDDTTISESVGFVRGGEGARGRSRVNNEPEVQVPTMFDDGSSTGSDDFVIGARVTPKLQSSINDAPSFGS